MRVLHLIDHLGLGGTQPALVDLLETRSADVDAAVASLSGRVLPVNATRLAACGVHVERLNLRQGDLRALSRLRRMIRTSAPDLLHTHLQFSHHVGAAVALSLGRARPVFVAKIDSDPRGAYSWGDRLASRLLRRLPDAHLVPGASIATAVAASFGRVRRIEVIPNGIDLGRFAGARPDPAAVAALRAGAAPVIGALGRLAHSKGLDVLLEALPRIREAWPLVRLLIVGAGPLRARLEAQVTRLGLTDAVAFEGYRADVESVYGGLDALVFPSRAHYESQGLVVLEAMAMGVPVVATRVSGVVDVVEHERTGLLVAPEDPAALAAAVLRLSGDGQLRRTLVDQARRDVAARFSREAMTASIETLYHDLLAARASAGERARRAPPGGRID